MKSYAADFMLTEHNIYDFPALQQPSTPLPGEVPWQGER